MIRFETINGTLCRMVEPTPLQLDSEFPCVVRLIQDDSRLGILNKLLHEGCYHEIYLCTSCNHQVCHILINGEEYDDFYPKYEIIGYPVTEGSAEWALYQMMQGHEVCNPDIHGGAERFAVCDGRIVHHVRNAFEDYCAVDSQFFPPAGLSTGWQIYEHEQPKPLLADAQVGDLCRRRDGKWVQIDRLLSIGGMPWICYEIGGLRYINNGEQLNSKLSELGIISTEPLAPEGTAEWAWQMAKLGIETRCYDRKIAETQIKKENDMSNKTISITLHGEVTPTYPKHDCLFWLFYSSDEYVELELDALSPEDRKIVEEKLKAQDEEK